MTACIGGENDKWRRAVDKYHFADAPRWTNLHVKEDAAGILAEILGKSGGALLLLDAEGRVLHSNILPKTLFPALRESLAAKETQP